MYEGIIAEPIKFRGHNGDVIGGYLSRPLGAGPSLECNTIEGRKGSHGGVVVVHHAPGYDEATREITHKLAVHGYAALCPNLHYRENPDDPEAAAAAVRAAGGVPDDRCIGDVEGAIWHLRSLVPSNGKIGLIGYCSGGRQVYLAACTLPGIDAAVDCYGGGVVMAPDRISPRQPVPPIDLTANLGCPLLGLFGAEDRNPSPDDVKRTEEELKRFGKTYEFYSYENAGHSFFSVDRPAYRQAAAIDGWQKVFDWFARYLR
ncbi:MAG: dienelactone hydrolase family protein [Chloroflexi bacterium]|nr:dienelactone hydrolase family protein [Chloroflexota bacterium]